MKREDEVEVRSVIEGVIQRAWRARKTNVEGAKSIRVRGRNEKRLTESKEESKSSYKLEEVRKREGKRERYEGYINLIK